MELDEKLEKVHSSLMKAKDLGMNIPEIILWNKSPSNDDERVSNRVIAEAYGKTLKSNKVQLVLPGHSGYRYLFKDELTSVILPRYLGDALLVLKAPKTLPLVTGRCIPGPYSNRIRIAEEERSIIWSHNPELPFPIGLKKAVMELNKTVQRGRMVLDGMELVFSFHSKGEGLFGDRILIWGSYIGN